MRNRTLPLSMQLAGLGMRNDPLFVDQDFGESQSSRPASVEQIAPIVIPPSVSDPAWPIINSTGQELRGPWMPDAALIVPGSAGSGTKTILPDPTTPRPNPDPLPVSVAPTPAPASADPSADPVTSTVPLQATQSPAAQSPVMLPLYAAETAPMVSTAPAEETAAPNRAKTILALLSLLAMFSN